MNLKIKFRESFRPFAPSCLEEKASAIFDLDHPSPYMLLVAQLQEKLCIKADTEVKGFDRLKQARSTLPAITHVDASARVQTVNQET